MYTHRWNVHVCSRGHYFLDASEDQRQYCLLCHEMVDVTIIHDAEALMAAAEALEEFDDTRHMLADQAILAKLRPSAPDFARCYDQMSEEFLYSPEW